MRKESIHVKRDLHMRKETHRSGCMKKDLYALKGIVKRDQQI